MKARAYNILHYTGFLLCAALLVLLPAMIGSCSHSHDYTSANEMKDYVSKALDGDTSEYARQQARAIDSLHINSDLDKQKVFRTVNRVTNNYLHNGRNVEAIKFLNGAMRILEDSADRDTLETRALIGIYVCIGAAYEQAGMPSVGLDYYMKGLKLATDTTYTASRAMLYNNIGVLYCEGGIYDKGESFFKQALDINLRAGNSSEIYLNYTNLSDTYEHTGELQRALDAALRSLQHVSPDKNPEHYYFTQIILGSLYTRTGDIEMATTYVENGMKHLEQINYVIGMVEAYEAFARIYLRKEMPDSAMVYADKSLQMARAAGLHRNESSALEVMVEVQNALGNSAEAMRMLERSHFLEDSLHNAESRLRLTQWEASGNMSLADVRKVPEGVNRWLLAGCILLLFIALGLLLLYFRLRHNKDEKLQKGADDTRELLRTLDRKNRELTTLSLEKMKAHEGLLSLCDDLRHVLLELNPKLTSQRTRIRELLGKLSSMSDNYSDEEFKHFFEEVHPDFYKALAERCPDLTMRDLRLCAFLYLGLTTKEIATITYREVRSVESARNRLRKKLGLELTVDLTAYLRSLAP